MLRFPSKSKTCIPKVTLAERSWPNILSRRGRVVALLRNTTHHNSGVDSLCHCGMWLTSRAMCEMCESSAMSCVTIFHRIYCVRVVNGLLGSSPSVHAGYAFNSFGSASLDHIVLFEFVYLMLKLKKTHAVLRLQLSTEVFFFPVGQPPPSSNVLGGLCCGLSACLSLVWRADTKCCCLVA